MQKYYSNHILNQNESQRFFDKIIKSKLSESV